jgi:hypothetical protein
LLLTEFIGDLEGKENIPLVKKMENVEKNKGRNDEKRAAPRCNEDKCTDA